MRDKIREANRHGSVMSMAACFSLFNYEEEEARKEMEILSKGFVSVKGQDDDLNQARCGALVELAERPAALLASTYEGDLDLPKLRDDIPPVGDVGAGASGTDKGADPMEE